MNIIEQYQEELQKDMHIDELNVTQVAHILPSIKHKWVARLINSKIKINKLEKLKKDSKEQLIFKVKESSTNQSLLSIDRAIDNSEEYKKNISKIDEEIENLKIIVLYLEKIENIFKSMTFDIKNIIDLNKLETT